MNGKYNTTRMIDFVELTFRAVAAGVPNPGSPTIPMWKPGNSYGLTGQVNVDTKGNITDPSGNILIRILNGMDPGDGLYRTGEVINSSGGVAKGNTIQRKEVVTKYRIDGAIDSSTEQSRDITKAVEKIN